MADPRRLPGGPSWGGDPDLPDAALDWLTLVRLLGWGATVAQRPGPEHGVVIVTGRPEELPARTLDAVLSRPRLVVAPATRRGGEWARLAGAAAAGPASRGGRVTWSGPGPPGDWGRVDGLDARPLLVEPGTAVWATFDGAPLIVARPANAGSVIATVGLDAARARATSGAATALLKRLLTCGCPFPTAWLDLAGTLVLRMDDPGASANVHLRSWSYAKLSEHAWDRIGADLRARAARLTVAYTPGWVDDGDAERGMLEVDGSPVARAAGAIQPSPLVRHVDRRGNCPGRVNDYQADFRGVSRLEAAGLVGVEPHGYTHMTADLGAWAEAPDRYDEVAWYQELTPATDRAAAGRVHPVLQGAQLIRRYFGRAPTTLVTPGQAWTETAIAHALDAGLRLVSADRLALRHGERFCWCAGVAVEYLDNPDPAALESELPAVAYFHDHELATIGLDWMAVQLDAWRRAGARRFIDLRELAAALALRLDLRRDGSHGWTLTADPDPSLPPPRPLPVMLWADGGEPPHEVEEGGGRLRVQPLGDGLGRLVLPVTAASRPASAANV